MPRSLANRFLTIFYFILLVGLFPSQSNAKSAIAISENGQKYGFCYDIEDQAEAEKCAMYYCNQSDKNCQTFISCEDSGFGTVFQNYTGEPGKGIAISPKNSVTVAVCGKKTTTSARDSAEILCKKASKKKNPTLGLIYCFEKAFWYDTVQIKSRPTTKAPKDKWCEYATELSGISSYSDCLKSLRFPNPKEDCKQKAKIWCN
tara:strand:+ start:257 stop:865 length:609 start_codon:yes stop_codon:yes gene_type:complete